ncbi:MAG TPA: RNA-binding protein [Ruminococcaceae bacterium]|nr:RNA-binding protein [Oscillospiraceae bacterium]
MREVKITTEYIRLDAFLKLCGAVGTGGQAKIIIAQGEIAVNGEICTQRGRKLRPEDTVSTENEAYRVIFDDSL